jgi:ATP-dependent Clp protease ATP-binding subunit ClpA
MILRSYVTTRLHEVFDEAYSLAEQGEPAQITASHLLLALLREGKSLGAQYLHIRGVPMHELAVGLAQELGASVENRKASVPDRPWTPDGEVWLRAAHEEATRLWPEHSEMRKVASTETLLLALLAESPRHFEPNPVGHEDCMAVIRWAHEPADSRGELPSFLA